MIKVLKISRVVDFSSKDIETIYFIRALSKEYGA